jgi:GT2 family glycosyltransferase
VGGVVIGKNEGERLLRGLAICARTFAFTVYVDSNSTDGSREGAKALGAAVLHLTAPPFTPSRGRQEGLEELVRLRPDLEFVHFIDGDCILQDGWLEAAVRYLDEHADVAAVFGRRREEKVAESFYSRLMDVDWEHPPGVVSNFGGDALVRTKVIVDAGGWSATTINAEDIDVSFRIREKGHTIVRLGHEMTSHDARMTRFSEYYRRSLRAGYGYLEVGLRYKHGPGKLLLKRARSSFLYFGFLPLLMVGLAFVWWPLALLPLLLYARVMLQMTLWARRRGAKLGTAVAYAGLNLICKAASMWGGIRFLVDRMQGRGKPRDELIIYRKS